MDFEEYDRIMRHMDAVMDHLDQTTAELRATNQRMDDRRAYYDDLLERSQATQERIEQLLTQHNARFAQNEATLARLVTVDERLEALLRRLLHPGGNGEGTP